MMQLTGLEESPKPRLILMMVLYGARRMRSCGRQAIGNRVGDNFGAGLIQQELDATPAAQT